MKRVLKISFVLVVILVLALLVSVFHHYQLRAATNAYIAELKAKGELLDLAQVLPPPVSPDQDSAETFRKAAAMMKADKSLLATNDYFAMKMVAPGKAMVCSQQPDAKSDETTNSWKEVDAAVAQNADSFSRLRQITDKPAFNFQIHYEKGFEHLDFTNMSLAEIKRASLRLQTAVLSGLHRNDSASAVKNLRATLALIKATREEDLVIAELVRFAITAIAVSGTWETLQSTNVTDEQLAALQKDWTGIDFFHSLETAIKMERAVGEITVKEWRSPNSDFEKQFMHPLPWISTYEPTAFDQLRIKFHVFQWRYWWSYLDEIRRLKGESMIVNACHDVQTNGPLLSIQQDLDNKIEKLGIPPNESIYFATNPSTVDLHYALSDSAPILSRSLNRAIKTEVAKTIVVTAIALKRYHLKHAEYPESLSELMPEFLSTLPNDPIDGQPLRYRRNSDGAFVLYSIGEDGKDGGGDVTPLSPRPVYWQRAPDWVWPQPATAEEIQNFYNNPPK